MYMYIYIYIYSRPPPYWYVNCVCYLCVLPLFWVDGQPERYCHNNNNDNHNDIDNNIQPERYLQ